MHLIKRQSQSRIQSHLSCRRPMFWVCNQKGILVSALWV
jgi:hypothetical protein